MNVVFIISDQHNPTFTGCYSGITRTPNIDSLAVGGARFENAYSNCPICVPARASMFTGKPVTLSSPINLCWSCLQNDHGRGSYTINYIGYRTVLKAFIV